MLRLTAGVLLLSLVAGSNCPDQQRCGDEQTCCQIHSGEFNCCPFHQGECCEDHLHCCPEGMLCEVKDSRCTNATHSLPWAERFPSEHSGLVNKPVLAVLCADGISECPVETSCCETADGGWGCCPMPRAVCCDDKVHCCPEDSVCDVNNAKCMSSTNHELPMWAKFPARQRAAWEDRKYSDVPCDDTSACPDGTTCCKDEEGAWSCCPLPQAVCCEDFIHCCPHGKKCNLAAQTCEDPSGSVPWLKKEPSLPIGEQKVPETKVSDVPCDDTSACPDGTTCCKDEQGAWSCCPLPQAVCCEDFIHCCPHGKKCNLAAQTCEDPSGSVPWLKKEPSRPIGEQKVPETKVSDVPCDETSACPDGTTCCKDEQGAWSCCPLPQAVCCEDFIHCCPHGKKCNLAAQTCEDPSGSVPWLKKEPSRPIGEQKVPETKVSDVPCDDTSACPDGTTCCKDEQGAWSCCPLPQAVCCEDFIHCCPHGKKCNLAAQTCEDPSGSVPWLKKEPSRPIGEQKVPETKVSDVPCDDTSACPDGTTCCKDEQGAWSCCPLPQAVCCEDFIHCCPHGKKCNLAAQTCEDPSGSVPWLKKEPSRPIGEQKVPETKVSDVPCDDTSACPDGTTCCKDEQGAWSCCPLPQAVCCEDFIHCCPHGKKCNLAAQTCEDPSGSVPWLKKEPSRPIQDNNVSEDSVVPCNETVACADGTTCCKTQEGGWSCCPLPQAVCCEDFIHCCPNGKKCNLAAQTCEDPSGSVPWLKKEPSRPIRDKNVPDTKVSDVPCDDTTACPDETTCCKTEQGQWSCCPLPQAVCCEDFIHCCPHGTKCNLAAQTCDDPSGSVSWLKKEPSRPTARATQNTSTNAVSVKCDPHMSCPDHTTCCFMKKSQKWGCCPLDQATCCADGENCCPKGYTCRDQQCVKSSWIKFDSVSFASVWDTANPQIHTDIDCGGGFTCKDSETCCRMSASSWGCCPLPKAVCCSDMLHCCPAGYICDESGSCTSAMGFYPDVFFSRKKRARAL
ncbi:granulin a [Ictalurus furcatus]|uniref:granulin a n=1 Tax=Ictalurus furcatus TaxID=66913 RepID=UPI002350C054|nr:granulin a [Ictalurus furcatus]